MSRTSFYISILLVVVSIIVAGLWNKSTSKYTTTDLNVEQIIQKYEYPVEVHSVTTEDGYILTLYRIPHGKDNSFPHRGPILLLPGVLQSAWDYVHYGPDKCLSFLLSEKGYDVWLGNFRGTTWSRKHILLNPDEDPSFWNFTQNEIGKYDLPAFIDYVLEVTNHSSLHYVGFSQGVIAFCIMGSEKSEYLNKIKLLTALAPAIYMKNPKSPFLNFIANNQEIIQPILKFFNYHEIFRRGDIFTTYLQYICDENSIFVHLCLHHIFITCGDDYDQMPTNMLSLTVSQFPAGMSVSQIRHIFQIIHSGNFSRYDFGMQGNIEKYGQEYPPHYNLSKITVPVALYYSTNDWAINVTGVQELIKILPNVVNVYKVPSEKFNHYDFLAAKNVVPLLYNAVINEILKYN